MNFSQEPPQTHRFATHDKCVGGRCSVLGAIHLHWLFSLALFCIYCPAAPTRHFAITSPPQGTCFLFCMFGVFFLKKPVMLNMLNLSTLVIGHFAVLID